MSDLIRQIKSRDQGPIRTGVVTAVSTAEGLDVLIGGGLVTGLQFLSSYTAPGVGDVVKVFVQPGSMLVLGKMGSSGGNLGPNLLPNPGFELGTVGNAPSSWTDFWSIAWPAHRALWLSDETQAHSSGASARAEVATLAAAEYVRVSSIEALAVGEGFTYRVAAWFRSPVADPSLTLVVNVHTAPTADGAQPFGLGVNSFDVASTAPTGTGWVEIAGVRTIPVGHNYLRVFLQVLASGTPVTPYVYVDDVSLRQQI